jgi:hypothetical protein
VDDQPQLLPPPKRRIGRFIVGHQTFAHDWHALLPVMAKVVIVRAESMYHLAAIEYLALCDDFDLIEPTDTPPLYDVKMEYLAEEKETVTFSKEVVKFSRVPE